MVTASRTRAQEILGYDDELAVLRKVIATLELLLQRNPRDAEKRISLAYRQFQRASLTGKIEDFEAVDTTISDIIREFGPKEDICLLKANLDSRFHRLAKVKQDLQMAPQLASRFEGRVLLADVDFQEGRYGQARAAFESLIEENRTWDNLARLAHWKGKMGQMDEADRLYIEAEDELTAKEMRSYAWIELQRGVLATTRGRYGEARWHYQRAEAAYPGHWHTDEHVAELLAVEGKFDEAVPLFQSVILRTPKPELKQALGELFLFMGKPEEAQPLFEAALATYLASTEKGDVHYYHHLAHFYTQARQEPAEAVKWARKDIALRSNFFTQAALALALHRNGEVAEGLHYIGQALSSGVQDGSIFATAAELFEAAGESVESKGYARADLEFKPRGLYLHMHH